MQKKILGYAVYPQSVKILREKSNLVQPKPQQTPHKQAISSFTDASKRRLKFVASNSTPKLVSQFCLTYHKRWNLDGRAVKKHLNTFLQNLRNHYKEIKYLWILEFQTSGMPHFHLFLSAPSTTLGLQEFMAIGWNRITEETPEHLRFHSHPKNFIAWNMGNGSYLSHKYLSKESQKKVPENFLFVGRFWGASRSLVSPPEIHCSDDLDFIQVDNVNPQTGEVTKTPTTQYIHRALCKFHEKRLQVFGFTSKVRYLTTCIMLSASAGIFNRCLEYVQVHGNQLF